MGQLGTTVPAAESATDGGRPGESGIPSGVRPRAPATRHEGHVHSARRVRSQNASSRRLCEPVAAFASRRGARGGFSMVHGVGVVDALFCERTRRAEWTWPS
ncbi:hypothetical protein [Haladaptatus sp. W1]|uniref:hypothetical protein n=1 Tax=Haladaptatus sp. W1 TaxID=1897478 RepID=UPI0020C80F51|nr:hypothetical protein [Haladaptatus sp. W1]